MERLGWVILAQDLSGGYSQMSAGLQQSDGLNGPEDLPPRWFTHMVGGSVFSMRASLCSCASECPHDVATGSLQNKQSEKPRQKLQCLYDLASEVTHYHFRMFYQSHRPALVQCRRGLYKGVKNQEVSILEAGYPTHLQL